MDDEARQNLKESFAHDMAEHQRVTGKVPTPSANERLAVPFFEQLEQKIADRERRGGGAPVAADPRPAESDPEHKSSLRRECERRGRERAADFMAIRRLPDKDPVAVVADPADLERGLRMIRRLELLLTKPDRGVLGAPSWRERAMAVIALKKFGADPRRTAYELVQLCEDSIAPFGPWDVPEGEGRPLIFT